MQNFANSRQRIGAGLAAGLVMAVCSVLAAEEWPAFRGPRGDGKSEDADLPVEWGPEKNVKWKVRLPAPANSSPIVSRGRVFITYAEDQGRQRHLVCFDRNAGEELWKATAAFDKVEETHQTNPYCGSTPATDGERIVVWHGSAGMYCYDRDGQELWSRDLGEFHHVWGYGSSPILYDGKVIQLCGPGARTMLAALSLVSGEVLWQTPEPGSKENEGERYVSTWSTPLLIQVDGRTQLLVALPTRVGAFDPNTGRMEWFVDGVSSERSDVCYTSPLVSEGVGVVLAGYQGPGLGFLLGGTGNITEKNLLWRDPPAPPTNPQRIGSGIAIGEHVFMANADGPGSIECFDLRTGKSRWKERRGAGGAHWGSMVFADGRLYATGQKGVTTVFAPNPDRFEVLAENDLAEQTNSTPAVSDGEIFLRTFDHLYCIGK